MKKNILALLLLIFVTILIIISFSNCHSNQINTKHKDQSYQPLNQNIDIINNFCTNKHCELKVQNSVDWESFQAKALANKSFKKNKYDTVRLYFATNRQSKENKSIHNSFGNQYTNKLTYGICDVSIPYNHKIGNVERPTLWRFELREDPNKHITIISSKKLKQKIFYEQIQKNITNTDSILIFIHGFNVSFLEAARRTAQLKYDLKYSGPTIFFSWASTGGFLNYTKDTRNISLSKNDFKKVVIDTLLNTHAKKIFLMAHSMGSRALLKAFHEIVDATHLSSRIKNIIVAAPDIDQEVFRKNILPSFKKAQRKLTLYASSKDQALKLSQKINGYTRLGDSGENLFIDEAVTTIDSTNSDTSIFLGHSYFSNENSLLNDIHGIIVNELPPHKRFNLKLRESKGGQYWEIQK